MSDTATGRWDIPGRTDTPHGRQPYPDATTAPDPVPNTDPTPAAPASPAEEAPVKPSKARRFPLAQWFNEMREDSAARRARSDAKWVMRWMGEQPTSVRDHVDYLMHERYKRKDSRKGWGLRTEAALIDGVHAFFYRIYGLTIGLAVTLACYALAWIAQRPGRFTLLTALIYWLIRA